MVRIAFPNKGRLSADTRSLFDEAGLGFEAFADRALVARAGEDFEVLFVRAQDIPEFVADGAADAGITGFDLVTEAGRDVVELIDLRFGRCRAVVAGRDDGAVNDVTGIPEGARVATAFPRLAARYFAGQNRAVTIVPVTGATEVAPHLGIADFVVDITSTGSTLRVNGLREIGTILESTARLIASRTALADPARKQTLTDLTAALGSVLRARGQRYLMANVPRAALRAVRDVLPGLNGPTVVDILDGDSMVAIHAVVSASSIYRTIATLESLGARGILVTRIERLTA
jgi:ATP phosphoribosyltransferase